MHSQFKTNILQRVMTSVPLIISLTLSYFYAPFWVLTAIGLFITYWITCIEWPKLVSPRTKLFWVLTPFYPTAPLLLCLLLLHSAQRPTLIFIILLIFLHDSAAYFVGNMYGKHLLAPHLSPKKTWEGALAGLGITLLFFIIFAPKITPINSIAIIKIISLAALFSFLATTGDLFESYFKRRAGVKDSGTLLPGHGGLLDKIDGLLFVVPVLYVLLHHTTFLTSFCLTICS